MIIPGWKTLLFFAIMGVVLAFKQFVGVEIPPEIAEKLTEAEINKLADMGSYIYEWITIVGGFFFLLVEMSTNNLHLSPVIFSNSFSSFFHTE